MSLQPTNLEERPLFICGLPRTGTSLLLGLLDGHPELVVASHESKFFLSFLPRALRLTGKEKRRLAERALFLVWWKGDYREKFLSHVPMEDVFEAFRARLEASPKRDADYLTSSVLGYGEATGQITGESRYWVEKTPFNEQYADFIFSSWTHAKCIHLMRDPRDLLCTYQKRDRHHGRPVTPLSSVVHSWRKTSRCCRENLETYGEDRYLEVRYEDLTGDPERELRRILEFVGISDHEILRRPTRGGGKVPWQGNAVDRRFSGIDASQVGRWRDEVEPRKLRVLEAVVGEEMKRHGYPPELETSLGARIGATCCGLVNSLRPVLAPVRRAQRWLGGVLVKPHRRRPGVAS